MSTKSPLKIEQDEKYKGGDYWSWSVWVGGPKSQLDQIKYVEYTLHPTFSTPVRRISRRANGFKLSTSGWGVFPIYAQVVKKDGTMLRLKHQLRLHYPDLKPNKL
jgi:transcription initiation factor IIF auxiliary subunit